MNDFYVLVQWPWSQEFMEEDWFQDEAIFCGGSEDKTGSSAYFIPVNRIEERVFTKQEVIEKIKEFSKYLSGAVSSSLTNFSDSIAQEWIDNNLAND